MRVMLDRLHFLEHIVVASGLPRLEDHLHATISCDEDNEAFLKTVSDWAK